MAKFASWPIPQIFEYAIDKCRLLDVLCKKDVDVKIGTNKTLIC